MIVVHKIVVIFIGALSSLLIAALGITGYLLMRNVGPGTNAELFLFWSLVAILASFMASILMIARGLSLDRRLNRLIEQGGRRDITPGRDFLVLGKLGNKLRVIFEQISRQNSLKRLKISSMNGLVAFLVRNENTPISICNALGEIQYANESVEKFTKLERTDIVGARVQDVFPYIQLSEIRAAIIRNWGSQEIKQDGMEFTCHPIGDELHELAYLVFLFKIQLQ